MKITKEDIKGLDVITYIEWLCNIVEDITDANGLLQYAEKQLQVLSFRSWAWLAYNAEITEHSIWYNRYETLADERKNELKADIEKYKADLQHIHYLANPRDSSETVKEAVKNRTASTLTLQIAKTIDFKQLNILKYTSKNSFYSFIDLYTDEIKQKLQFDKNAVEKVLNDIENMDFKYVEFIAAPMFCRDFFYDFMAVQEFATLAYLNKLANWSDNSQNKRIKQPVKTLNKTQFTELVKALFEVGVLQYETEKEAVEILATVLNIDITKAEFDRILQKIKGRNINNETIFIDSLKKAVEDWINK